MISAFGLAVELAFRVPELEGVPPPPDRLLPAGPTLRVELAETEELDAAWSGAMAPPARSGAVVDGSSWTAERGCESDLRMDHALCRFHLDPAAALLRCAPRDTAQPAWRRLLLDTALVTATLVRGHDALHAACVATPNGAIVIAGASGMGKTTLLLGLMRAGARFLADDVVALGADTDAGEVMALASPPVANVPEAEAVVDVAEPLHRLGSEWWVRVRGPCFAPTPIRTVLVLGEATDGPPRVTGLRDAAVPLLGHALQSGSTPQRREQRLTRLARLAQTAEVMAVAVDHSRPPGELVEAVIDAVPLLQT